MQEALLHFILAENLDADQLIHEKPSQWCVIRFDVRFRPTAPVDNSGTQSKRLFPGFGPIGFLEKDEEKR
jgi:hypothetical protein